MKKIRICIPFYQDFEPAKSFYRDLGIEVTPRQGTYIWQIRNHLVGDGQHKPVDVDGFVFIDSDVSGEPQNLVNLLTAGKDIVGGCYKQHRSKMAYAWKDGDALPYDIDGMREVDAVGTGFLYVSRRVFDVVPYPWFYHPYLPEISPEPLSEDINFCRLARRSGFTVWCDFDNKVNHVERTQGDFKWT